MTHVTRASRVSRDIYATCSHITTSVPLLGCDMTGHASTPSDHTWTVILLCPPRCLRLHVDLRADAERLQAWHGSSIESSPDGLHVNNDDARS